MVLIVILRIAWISASRFLYLDCFFVAFTQLTTNKSKSTVNFYVTLIVQLLNFKSNLVGLWHNHLLLPMCSCLAVKLTTSLTIISTVSFHPKPYLVAKKNDCILRDLYRHIQLCCTACHLQHQLFTFYYFRINVQIVIFRVLSASMIISQHTRLLW